METIQCVKCPSLSTISGSEGKNVAYCDKCYKEMLTHKFRSALGKRRVFKDGASKEALVIVDGSPSSVFLMGQIIDAIKLNPHQRLVMEPTIVMIVSSTVEGVMARVSDGQKQVIHLASVLRPFDQKLLEKDRDADDEMNRLVALLSSCKSSTSREELKRILKERLMIRLSSELNLNTILVSDCADDLARISLSSLCIGRGAQILDMTGGVEKRKGLVTVVRPLKEVRSKEIALGNRLFGWEKNVIYVEEDERIREQSIQMATDEFINTLHNEGFQSTVSTVLSTSSKVHLDISSNAPLCTLCMRSFSKDLIGLCPPCESILEEVPDWQSISHLIQ